MSPQIPVRLIRQVRERSGDVCEYGVSRSSSEPALFGYTPDGRYIIVVYCEIDEFSAFPVTAFEVQGPQR